MIDDSTSIPTPRNDKKSLLMIIIKISILNIRTRWTLMQNGLIGQEELNIWVVSSKAHDWENANTGIPWYSRNRICFQWRKHQFLKIFYSDFLCPYNQRDAFSSCNADLGITDTSLSLTEWKIYREHPQNIWRLSVYERWAHRHHHFSSIIHLFLHTNLLKILLM